MARRTERDNCLLICFSFGTVDAPLNLRLRGAWAVTGHLVMCMAVVYAEHAVHGCLRCRDLGLVGYYIGEPQTLRSETPFKRM